MLIFIPADDYSATADDATSITSLEYEFIAAENQETKSFRIGNTSSESVSYLLRLRGNDNADFRLSGDSGLIEANQISDTISLTLSVPADTLSMGFVFDLNAVTDAATYTLEISYEAVGANQARRPQYPDRASSFTNQVTNVIDRVSELLQLFIYDPIGYVSPNPDSRKMNLFTDPSDPCVRLDPTNQVHGYTAVEDRLRASFQNETRDIVTSFDAHLPTVMTYQTSGSLVIPATEEIVRRWALFSAARGNDAEQHKRTVLVIVRQGELYSIENIIPKYRGEFLSHFEADLMSIHKRDMGSPDFWNPWARTYRRESDKPYKQFACVFEVEDLLEDVGSNASMGSNLLGSDVS